MNTRTPKYIDLSALQSITKGNNQKLAEYIELYLEQTPEEINLLKKYFTEKNWNSLKITAHNMKSKAGYMGAQKLKELAELIEEYDKNSDMNKLNDLICNFAQHFELVKIELLHEKNILNK